MNVRERQRAKGTIRGATRAARRIPDSESVGRPDGADFENGYGDSPEAVAETIRRRAKKAGLVEGRWRKFDWRFAAADLRVCACGGESRGGSGSDAAFAFPFVVVGRAENFLHERLDLDDTIRRDPGVRGRGGGRAIRAGPNEGGEILIVGYSRAVCMSRLTVSISSRCPDLSRHESLS